MVFENKNSHWIDAYTSKFEESFKNINLLEEGYINLKDT